MTQAIIITGATSGMGEAAALQLATSDYLLLLVARNQAKLEATKSKIEKLGGKAAAVRCDFSDLESIRAAVNQIIELGYELVGLANNAGIQAKDGKKSAQGYELSFATNALGPVLFTELLLLHLAKAARLEFTVSAVEDPERKFAVRAGFRGSRFLTVADTAKGNYKPGGSKVAGFDAYATSKQIVLAYAMQLARENPELKINALEPGLTLGTGLGTEDASPAVKFLARHVLPALAPLAARFKYMSTPKIAGGNIARLITAVETNGGYYNEKGGEQIASHAIQQADFCLKVTEELRTFIKGA